MSNVPEGAQLSDDGQWWWDGENWQAVGDGSSPAQAQGTFQLQLSTPRLNGSAIEWDVSNVGSAEAPTGTPAGSVSFEYYTTDTHWEVATYDAQLRQPLGAYASSTVGVLVLDHCTADGHYQLYLTLDSVDYVQIEFDIVNGQITTS
jgi:hypothetical protein